MEILFEVLGIIIDFQFYKQVTQEDINRNINKLKQYEWFQDLLRNEDYYELIVSNVNVRNCSGKFKTKKLDNDWYIARCEQKLIRVLEKNIK